MGAATAIGAGSSALGAVTGAIQAIGAGKTKRAVAAEIAKQKEVPLTNVADGLQVSTRSADLQKEQQAQLAATQIGALQDGGTRALLGGIGRVSANSNAVNAEIGAGLDQQQKEIDQIGAQDNANIRSMKEQRAANKLAALSSQYNAASQNQAQAVGNIVQGLGSAATSLAYADKKTKK